MREDVPKEAADCSRRAYVWRGGEGQGQRVQRGRQLRTGADLSLVTVRFSWTLVKGFLRREESGLSAPRVPTCRQGAAGLLGEPGGATHSRLL